MIRLLAIAVPLLSALPTVALAQAYQCALPATIGKEGPPHPKGPAVRAPIAGYTLAVSWSPEYCRDPRQAGELQCSGAIGRFGFVVHGLWPEARSGQEPQWCSLTPRPSRELIRRNLCMTPVPKLLEHEWAKHGSCMSRTPEGYFRVSTILWRSLRWPDADRLSRQQGVTAGDLRRAFVARNSGWRAEQVGLLVSDTGWLREVHLCYRRDFMPAACDPARFGPADKAPLKIWRGL